MMLSLKAAICAVALFALGTQGSSVHADILINEIMYNPNAVSDTYGEWFEVYNPDAARNLQGYTIGDAGAMTLIEDPLTINARGYLVFARNSDPTLNGGIPGTVEWPMNLANSGDTLAILDPDGNEIDAVIYGDGTGFPMTTGASICFSGIGDNSLGENWFDARDLGLTFGGEDFGTPGAPNTPAVPEPASLILIGSGLFGIGLVRKK